MFWLRNDKGGWEMLTILVILGEVLIGVLAYRHAKANGTLPEPKPEPAPTEPYVQKPLRPDATRLEKIAHWLGLEETEEETE